MREGEEGCFYPGVLHGWCGGWESHSLRSEPPGPWWRVTTVLRRGAVYQALSQGPCSIFTTLVLAGDGQGNRHREGSVLPLLGGVRTQAETPLAASVPSPSLPVAGGAPQTPPPTFPQIILFLPHLPPNSDQPDKQLPPDPVAPAQRAPCLCSPGASRRGPTLPSAPCLVSLSDALQPGFISSPPSPGSVTVRLPPRQAGLAS